MWDGRTTTLRNKDYFGDSSGSQYVVIYCDSSEDDANSDIKRV